MKPWNENPRPNPTTPVGLNLWLCLSWAWTFENTRCNSPAPSWDLTTRGTSQIFHWEFWPSITLPSQVLLQPFTQVFLMILNHLQHKFVMPSQWTYAQTSCAFFNNYGDSIPPELSPTLSLEEDSCMHSLRQIPQLIQRIKVLQLYALPAAIVLQQFLRFATWYLTQPVHSLHGSCA